MSSRTSRAAGLLAAVAALLICLPPAQAQPRDEQAKRKAERLLAAGDQKLQRGDRFAARGDTAAAREQYAAALADYRAAFDAYPLPQIYFPIARAEDKLGRHLDALRHYQRLLDEVPDLKSVLRAETEKHLTEVKKRLAALNFRIAPAGALVEVNGNEVGIAPLPDAHWLEPGEHTYRVSAEGHEAAEGQVTLEAGDIVEEEVTLAEVEVVVAGSRRSSRSKATAGDPDAGQDRNLLTIGLAATGGLAAVATITGIQAARKHSRFNDEEVSEGAREKARSKGKKYAVATDLLFVAAAGAGALTAYYYYAVHRPEREIKGAAGGSGARARDAWIAPWVGPSGGGLAAGGSF